MEARESHQLKDVNTLLFYLRKLSVVDCNDQAPRDEDSLSYVYKILGKYNDSDEYDAAYEGDTMLLRFLAHLGHACSEHEALWIYLLIASIMPTYRWARYSRRLRVVQGYSCRTVFLKAYLESTSNPFKAFFRILVSEFPGDAALSVNTGTAALVLSVSTKDMLDIPCVGQKEYRRWKLAFGMIWLRTRAQRELHGRAAITLRKREEKFEMG